MDMRQLLETMYKFAGTSVGQKPGDQVRGTEKAKKNGKQHPFAGRLVGGGAEEQQESILKDLSKGPRAKTIEEELAEAYAQFNEEDLGVEPKRPARKGSRHHRGHEPHPRYKTVKTDEGYDTRDAYELEDPKHPDFKNNWEEYKAKHPDAKLADFISFLRSRKTKTNEAGSPAQQAAIAIAMKKAGKKPKNEQEELNQPRHPEVIDDLPKTPQDPNRGTVVKDFNRLPNDPNGPKRPIVTDESSMSEKDIELQDYRSMSHKEFQTAYGMTKTEWINKNKRLVITNPKIKQALGLDEGAEQDPIVARVVKQMRPGLTGLDMGNEAFLYFAYELGKQRARDAWEDYLPAIRSAYEKGLDESADLKKQADKYTELAAKANKAGDDEKCKAFQKKVADIKKKMSKQVDESYYGPVEARWMVKLSDDEGDHLKTFHDKFPSLSAAKKAYKNTPYATDFKYKPVKKDQVEEAVGQDTFNRAGYNPLRDQRDYLEKFKGLWDLYHTPNLDPQTKAETKQRILDLNAEARKKGFIQAESRGHTVVANKLKDVERAKKFASGELKVPTPQERQAQLKKLEKEKQTKVSEDKNWVVYNKSEKKPYMAFGSKDAAYNFLIDKLYFDDVYTVLHKKEMDEQALKEYGTISPMGTEAPATSSTSATTSAMGQTNANTAQDPKTAQAVKQGLATIKAATNSSAQPQDIEKGLTDLAQGKADPGLDKRIKDVIAPLAVGINSGDPQAIQNIKNLANRTKQLQQQDKQKQQLQPKT